MDTWHDYQDFLSSTSDETLSGWLSFVSRLIAHGGKAWWVTSGARTKYIIVWKDESYDLSPLFDNYTTKPPLNFDRFLQ